MVCVGAAFKGVLGTTSLLRSKAFFLGQEWATAPGRALGAGLDEIEMRNYLLIDRLSGFRSRHCVSADMLGTLLAAFSRWVQRKTIDSPAV